MSCEVTSIRIGNIKTSEKTRASEAEIKQFMESIRSVKLLQPLTVDADMQLIFGECRLEACKRLGMTHVPVIIRSDLDTRAKVLRAKRDENMCRFAPSRAWQLAHARELEEEENPEAAARKKAAQAKKGQGTVGGKFPSPGQKGKTKDKVGAVVGMSGKTLAKAQSVVEAGQTEPERYLDLAEKMGKDDQAVDPLHEEYKTRKRIYETADSDSRFADIANRLKETRDTDAAEKAFEERQEELSKDGVGQPIPKALAKLFADRSLKDAADFITQAIECVPANRFVHLDRTEVLRYLNDARLLLLAAVPFAVCKCEGAGCRLCKKSGWLTKALRETV